MSVPGKTILVVDDESSIRESLRGALADEGYAVETCAGGRPALDRLKTERPDVVLLDIWMPEMDGLQTLKAIKDEWPSQIVVMMSGHGTIDTAVKATKLGAFDFVEKPLSLDRLLVILTNACHSSDLSKENQELRRQVRRQKILVGTSKAIQQIQEVVARVAPSTGSVLITGENGTGKELVAHSIYTSSDRVGKPFVEVNCAAIPDDLIESELFGHEKGAFTGATQQRRGKFDLANGGTIFLDEIGDMSLKTQAKILRILQEQKFERVGGSQTSVTDVRVIAATNKDLKGEIAKGTFREDLFYRLNVVPIAMPSLRERKEDIPLLAEHFLKEFSQTYAKPALRIGKEAIDVLVEYSWPGNVRELRNLIERIAILHRPSDGEGPISAATLLGHLNDEDLNQRFGETGPLYQGDSAGGSRRLRDARQEFEKRFIQKTLEESDWNVSKAAGILGIERSHLHKKIKAFGIEARTGSVTTE